ncbi:phosphoenolpyruvate carboxykinase [SAR86 cluster bacterium]|nr:phosphoenolpyruvate carboxykinase [SAR86 cluster bacterium]
MNHNLPINSLLDIAIKNGEGIQVKNGAFVVTTGNRTGRSPADKFLVDDALTHDVVDWGEHNRPVESSVFSKLWDESEQYLKPKEKYTADLHVGASAEHYQPVTIENELAWHNMFCQSLFIQPESFNPKNKGIWHLRSVPSFKCDPARHGTNSDGTVMVNFSTKQILVLGIAYAGEMKKSMFGIMNFILPEDDVLSMHCAANAGDSGDVSLFFGLSGTGKTTLSADPNRWLIGDDEHGWGDGIVFNIEGGCYAKTVDLSQKNEPVIWNAIKNGTILENVIFDPKSLEVDYTNQSLTENTRACYPLSHVEQHLQKNHGGEPKNIIFLTCDLSGVMPPVSILTKEQAAYHFLSGYTAKVGSTELGSTAEISSTFSNCFGAPFFPRKAQVYADLLMKRIDGFDSKVFIVNSGWTGGSYGVGERFNIPTTRNIIKAIQSGSINNSPKANLEIMNVEIPTELEGVDTKLLNPSDTWSDQDDYKKAAEELAQKFSDNISKFDVDDEILASGPIR